MSNSLSESNQNAEITPLIITPSEKLNDSNNNYVRPGDGSGDQVVATNSGPIYKRQASNRSEEGGRNSLAAAKRRVTERRRRNRKLDDDDDESGSSETLHIKKSKKLSTHFKNIQHELGFQNHNVYIELEELDYTSGSDVVNSNASLDHVYHWNIMFRWIKYEQSYDSQTNMWSTPYVGALIYQNLIYLKNTLQYSMECSLSLSLSILPVIFTVYVYFI